MSKYLFRVVVETTTHGEIVGNWSERLTREQITRRKDVIKENWSGLTYLALEFGENEVIVPGEILRQSIIVLEVIDCSGAWTSESSPDTTNDSD